MLEKRSSSLFMIFSWFYLIVHLGVKRKRLASMNPDKTSNHIEFRKNQWQKKKIYFPLQNEKLNCRTVGKRGNGTAGRCDKGHELQPLSEGLRMGTRRRRSPSGETSPRALRPYTRRRRHDEFLECTKRRNCTLTEEKKTRAAFPLLPETTEVE